MSGPEVRVGSLEGSTQDVLEDVEMKGGDDVEIDEALEILHGAGDGDGDAADAAASEDTAEPEAVEEAAPKLTYVDYLRSPIIEILVGPAEDSTLLSAHQALLIKSPFFASAVAAFSADATTRRIEFPAENLEAMGAFLQYLYTGDYFPRRLLDRLENDPPISNTATAIAAISDGEELLRHARVYTLGEKLGLVGLKHLAHSKVHLVNSSAKGEIAYARYVYGHTPRTDDAIRRPIAMFWGQRSHVLRHDAEDDFRALCLEFPEFGYDVLSQVLDARERRSARGDADVERVPGSVPRSGKKRARLA